MRRFHYYTPVLLQKIGYIIFFVLYKLFVKIEIKGRENLKNLATPIILAPNHTSELDVTAIPLVLPFFSTFFPIYFVTNADHEYRSFGWRSYIYGGAFFNALGGYQINSGHKNYAKSLQNHIEILKKGNTLCIFPEGKRTLDNHMNPARGGLGYLAYVTGATVVPVVIDTFFNMNPRDFFMGRRKVTITILKPILAGDIICRDGLSSPCVEDFRHAGELVLNKIKEVVR